MHQDFQYEPPEIIVMAVNVHSSANLTTHALVPISVDAWNLAASKDCPEEVLSTQGRHTASVPKKGLNES